MCIFIEKVSSLGALKFRYAVCQVLQAKKKSRCVDSQVSGWKKNPVTPILLRVYAVIHYAVTPITNNQGSRTICHVYSRS